MITVQLDVTPLTTGHAHRGVGMYTRQLYQALQRRKDVRVVATGLEATANNEAELATDQPVPQVIHYPYFDLFFATLPARRSLPTVVTIHDVIPLKFPKFYQPGSKGRLRWWRQRWLVRQVAAIITDSEVSKQDIIKHVGVPASKVHVVSLAGNPDIQPVKPSRRRELVASQHLPARYILYVGDINYNKNVPQLIKALKYLPEDMHLVCVGRNFVPQPIPEWRWIEAQIAASDVASRVHLVPDLAAHDNETLAAIYGEAIAYVQPSLYEGFGLPILEAMQAQVPVVTSSGGSLPEVAGDHAVIVEPEAEQLAAGVMTVMSWSQAQRAREIQAAAAWAKRFSWRQAAAKTVAVYEQVVANARPRSKKP